MKTGIKQNRIHQRQYETFLRVWLRDLFEFAGAFGWYDKELAEESGLDRRTVTRLREFSEGYGPLIRPRFESIYYLSKAVLIDVEFTKTASELARRTA